MIRFLTCVEIALVMIEKSWTTPTEKFTVWSDYVYNLFMKIFLRNAWTFYEISTPIIFSHAFGSNLSDEFLLVLIFDRFAGKNDHGYMN